MNIAVIGSGYVGTVMGAALAAIGLRPNEAKTRILPDARGLGSTTAVSGGR